MCVFVSFFDKLMVFVLSRYFLYNNTPVTTSYEQSLVI